MAMTTGKRPSADGTKAGSTPAALIKEPTMLAIILLSIWLLGSIAFGIFLGHEDARDHPDVSWIGELVDLWHHNKIKACQWAFWGILLAMCWPFWVIWCLADAYNEATKWRDLKQKKGQK